LIARSWRRAVALIPFLFLLYLLAHLDRINVGFASLPSNIILTRVGARLWIARIMISWGIVSCAMMFVRSAPAFYALRFLLGATEAGFFPGIIYYLTKWSGARASTNRRDVHDRGPAGRRCRRSDFGRPAAARRRGIRGWQWLFLIEGVPAIVLGVVVMFVLKEGPADAVWLVPSERAALIAALEQEQHRAVDHSLSTVIRHGRTWLLAASTSPFR